MRPATFAAVLAAAVAGAIGAVAANFVVGARLFEPTVVANPYEAGLRYDEERKKGAAPSATPHAACDAARGPCRAAAPGGEVTLEVLPRPVRALADLEFVVRVPEGATPGPISLSMPGMTMGENRVKLSRGADGAWRGWGVVVRCPSGGRRWTASVALPGGAPALFDLELEE